VLTVFVSFIASCYLQHLRFERYASAYGHAMGTRFVLQSLFVTIESEKEKRDILDSLLGEKHLGDSGLFKRLCNEKFDSGDLTTNLADVFDHDWIKGKLYKITPSERYVIFYYDKDNTEHFLINGVKVSLNSETITEADMNKITSKRTTFPTIRYWDPFL
jgi:hypothetical protein